MNAASATPAAREAAVDASGDAFDVDHLTAGQAQTFGGVYWETSLMAQILSKGFAA